MHTHELDLASLIWGIILAAITGLLAAAVWTDATIDLGLVIPAALICAGIVALVAALVRKPAAAAADAPAEAQDVQWTGDGAQDGEWSEADGTWL